MKKQIPHGDENIICPFWRKPQSEVCHKCPLWVQIRGKNPQGEDTFDQWGCTLGFLPMLLLEGAQQTRQAGAAIESFRNEMVKQNNLSLALQIKDMNGHRVMPQIEGRRDDE